jgi:hypothetical protein
MTFDVEIAVIYLKIDNDTINDFTQEGTASFFTQGPGAARYIRNG